MFRHIKLNNSYAYPNLKYNFFKCTLFLWFSFHYVSLLKFESKHWTLKHETQIYQLMADGGRIKCCEMLWRQRMTVTFTLCILHSWKCCVKWTCLWMLQLGCTSTVILYIAAFVNTCSAAFIGAWKGWATRENNKYILNCFRSPVSELFIYPQISLL